MFVQCWRWMHHHKEMGTSHHLCMPRYLRWKRTWLRWKHCWSIQQTTICWMLERNNCWMCCMPRKLGIQRIRQCLSFWRKIPHWAIERRIRSKQFVKRKLFANFCSIPNYPNLFLENNIIRIFPNDISIFPNLYSYGLFSFR